MKEKRLSTILRKGIPLLAIAVCASLLALAASGADANLSNSVSIDFTTGDNTSTAVGTVDTTATVTSGATITVDVVFDGTGVSDAVAAGLTLGMTDGNAATQTDGCIASRDVSSSLLNNEVPNVGGSAVIDGVGSDALPGAAWPGPSRATHTVILSNDDAVGSGGATGNGILIRFTYNTPYVAAGSTAVTFSLTGVAVNDSTAVEIGSHTHNGTLTVNAGDTTTNDSDCDGFVNGVEAHAGTERNAFCSLNTGVDNEATDNYPADLNDDKSITSADLQRVSQHIGKAVPPAPIRSDIAPGPAGDNSITSADLQRVGQVIGRSC